MTTIDGEVLIPGASSPDDYDPDEERRARHASIDPSRLLTYEQVERIIEEEEHEAATREALTPTEYDSLEDRRALARERDLLTSDHAGFWNRWCATGCGTRVTFYCLREDIPELVYCNRHRDQPTLGPLECPTCGFTAGNAGGLASHQRTHE